MVTIETQLSQDIVTESATFPVLFYGKLIGCYFESLPYISFFPRTEISFTVPFAFLAIFASSM